MRAAAVLITVASVLAACSSTGKTEQGTPLPSSRDVRTVSTHGLAFTEVAAESGLTEPHSDVALVAEDGMTSGAAVADVDGDSDMDIFLPRVAKPNSLYLNDGTGRFTDVGREAGVAGPSDRFGSSAAAFFDVEGDGDLDLFVTGAGQGGNELFVNDGFGGFLEESTERGLGWPDLAGSQLGSQSHGVAVADVNQDGHMDLLVLQWYMQIYGRAASAVLNNAREGLPEGAGLQPCEAAAVVRDAGFPVARDDESSRSALFLNQGDGTFRNATDEFGLPLHQIVAFTGIFHDLDADGWLDLAITGDGCTSRLFRNLGGARFEDITEASGVGTDENAMGAAIRDINGDGFPDWFITSISYPTADGECPVEGLAIGCSGNRLYLNRGDATFTDATDQFGLRDTGWGWGVAAEDLSNDGSLEIAVTNGYEESLTRDSPSESDPHLDYFNSFVEDPTFLGVLDNGVYRDVASAVGLDDTTIGHALVPFDMDGDGDLDLLIVPSGEQSPLLYRNDSDPSRSWLTVSLQDPTNPGNSWGDGARIEVALEGSDPVVGWISTNGSYESQKPPVFHAGFGNLDDATARVEVLWPGSSTPQVVTNVDLRQHLEIKRESPD